LLDQQVNGEFEIITPRDPEERGCQLSILVRERARERFADLAARGVIADYREPDIIRVAPAPFYNTFQEVWKFAQLWRQVFNLPLTSPAS
jgi:kynureninase